MVHQVFVLLAGGTSLDVTFYPLIHVQPPVLPLRGLGGFISAWVSSGWGIVVALHDLPPQFYLRRNCYSAVLEPLGLVVMCGVEVEVVCIFPLLHHSSMGFLDVCYLLFQVVRFWI